MSSLDNLQKTSLLITFQNFKDFKNFLITFQSLFQQLTESQSTIHYERHKCSVIFFILQIDSAECFEEIKMLLQPTIPHDTHLLRRRIGNHVREKSVSKYLDEKHP